MEGWIEGGRERGIKGGRNEGSNLDKSTSVLSTLQVD